MSASEVKSKNFSMTGGILMVVSRLYAELDRGHQIHSMCHHSVEMQSINLLEQVNLSQQILANGTSSVHMKPEYLRLIGCIFEADTCLLLIPCYLQGESYLDRRQCDRSIKRFLRARNDSVYYRKSTRAIS